MSRKGPQIPKVCVICGKPFKVYPSDTKQCCSKKCGAALRTRNGKRGGTHWSLDAKLRFRGSESAAKAREETIPKGLAAAASIPAGQRGPQNREAMVWILIDPNGKYHKAVNLNDWARKNKDLFFRPEVDEDTAAMRIRSGFGAIASSMRGAKSRERRVQTYLGWRLAELPRPKRPGDDDFENQEENNA